MRLEYRQMGRAGYCRACNTDIPAQGPKVHIGYTYKDTIVICDGCLQKMAANLPQDADDANRLLWLQCLEDAGVDNWSGIDFAHELHREALAEAGLEED